jgi:hypothetical protein
VTSQDAVWVWLLLSMGAMLLFVLAGVFAVKLWRGEK